MHHLESFYFQPSTQNAITELPVFSTPLVLVFLNIHPSNVVPVTLVHAYQSQTVEFPKAYGAIKCGSTSQANKERAVGHLVLNAVLQERWQEVTKSKDNRPFSSCLLSDPAYGDLVLIQTSL